MAFDGIVTQKIVYELKNIIGYKIDKVYQPDKNTVVLGLYGKSTHSSLLACIASNNARLHLTHHTLKNPNVAPNFCMLLRKHLIGLKIKDIYLYDLERCVFIELENLENPNKPILKKLIFELMGKHSNIILTNESDIIIDSLRHTSIENGASRDIYPTSRFLNVSQTKSSFLKCKDFEEFYEKIEPYLTDNIVSNFSEIDDLNISNFALDKAIVSSFTGISRPFVKNVINELNIKTISKDSIFQIFEYIKKIVSSENCSFKLISNDKDYALVLDSNSTESLSYFLDDFYFNKESNELFNNFRNSILHLILAILKKYEKRLENIDSKLDECNNMDAFRLYGELITANLYKIPKYNIDSITLENFYDNNNLISIPLDKRFSPQVNAKHYFKKYSKLKNALELVNIQKKDTLNEINYIESIVYELESSTTVEEVQSIYDEISESNIMPNKNPKPVKKAKKAKNLTSNKLASFNPLKYVVDGFTIFVGRNNKENDYLTLKFAKKHDLWFHTKDIHGSHVILKTDLNEPIPDDVLYEAARLACKHSKAKNSSNVPVDYCKVSFVKKPNGSKPRYGYLF